MASAEYMVRTNTTVDEISAKAMSEERYQETTVGRLIFSNDPGGAPELPSVPLSTELNLPGITYVSEKTHDQNIGWEMAPGDGAPLVPKGEEGLCGTCGVALRRGIGNPNCRACYKPGHRPIGTYESGAARWGVANATGTPRTTGGGGGGRHRLSLASEPSDLDGGGGHHVGGVDIDDSNRWKKQMRGRAKQGGTVEKAGVRGTGAGVAKRVVKLSARVTEVEELKKKRDVFVSTHAICLCL